MLDRFLPFTQLRDDDYGTNEAYMYGLTERELDSFTLQNCSALGDFLQDSVALSYCNDTEVKSLCLNACQLLSCDENNTTQTGSSPTDIFYTICVNILSFLLLSGFAATIDARMFFENFKSKGVYVGLASQFLLMPLFGFIAVSIFHKSLGTFLAVMVLIVTACPGGAYSNWFCSVFNADLSLSVAMTTTSTFLAALFLPLNVFCYLQLYTIIIKPDTDDFVVNSNEYEYESGTITVNAGSSNVANSVISSLPYASLFQTLAIVEAGVIAGLVYGYCVGPKWQRRANFVGNIAGILLQLLALFASSTSCAPPWKQTAAVFAATALPLVLGIGVVLAITSMPMLRLPKPQRVAVVIEAGYQNTGIAVAVSLSLGSSGRAATVVPILYGTFQGIAFFIFCSWAIYAGYTLSPENESLCNLLFNDYQELIAVHPHYDEWRKNHPTAAEVKEDPNERDEEDYDEDQAVAKQPKGSRKGGRSRKEMFMGLVKRVSRSSSNPNLPNASVPNTTPSRKSRHISALYRTSPPASLAIHTSSALDTLEESVEASFSPNRAPPNRVVMSSSERNRGSTMLSLPVEDFDLLNESK